MAAVECVQKNELLLQLHAEKEAMGMVMVLWISLLLFILRKMVVIILVTEVKKEQFKQGAAQNLAQLHSISMVEVIVRKNKHLILCNFFFIFDI